MFRLALTNLLRMAIALSVVGPGAIALPGIAGNAPAGGTSGGSSFGIPFGSDADQNGSVTLSPDVQDALNATANSLIAQLGGNQTFCVGSVYGTATGGEPFVPLGLITRIRLQQLLLGQSDVMPDVRFLQAALDDLDGVDAATVKALITALDGLVANGAVDATKLRDAIQSYNVLLDSLSPVALTSLSTEATHYQQAFFAVHYVLASLSYAATQAQVPPGVGLRAMLMVERSDRAPKQKHPSQS